MSERKNLPTVIATQAVAVLSEQRASLVGRGLTAVQEIRKHELIRNSQDENYRKARTVFDRGFRIETERWTGTENGNTDHLSAFKSFQKLADEKYGKAYYQLYRWYEGEDIEVGQDHDKQHFAQLAFDWCFANQANQDVELWCDLGAMYRDGCGVGRNDEQAVNWFRKAAEQGYADGQGMLGEMYSYGRGVEKNNEQAVYWYRKAAEQNSVIWQWKLGSMYECGDGVEKNYHYAVYWYRKVAEQGDVTGQWQLGCMYECGAGVEQNDEQAVYWFRKAAEQGDALAQDVLRKSGIDWKK